MLKATLGQPLLGSARAKPALSRKLRPSSLVKNHLQRLQLLCVTREGEPLAGPSVGSRESHLGQPWGGAQSPGCCRSWGHSTLPPVWAGRELRAPIPGAAVGLGGLWCTGNFKKPWCGSSLAPAQIKKANKHDISGELHTLARGQPCKQPGRFQDGA